MKTKIIFFGNGPLADYSLEKLQSYPDFEIIFHAHRKEDLEEVKRLKKENPEAHGILASYGVIIKSDVLELFEPEGILNIHPSLLPKYRGPSPIETAILAGDTSFSVSVMKLVKAMDAGPIYYQTTLTPDTLPENASKDEIYKALATAGAAWLGENLENLPSPAPQNDAEATYTEKLTTSLSELKPSEKSSQALLNEIRAFIGFPKSKYTYGGLECTIWEAHTSDNSENALSVQCTDGRYITPDKLQPAGRKIMDAKSFINGYLKNR